MNVELPPPTKYTLAEWALIVGIVTTIVGALYALWVRAIMPLLRTLARSVLKKELDMLHANAKSLERMWPEQLEQRDTLQRIEENMRRCDEEQREEMQRIREAFAEMRGREGGRRSYDPK